MISLLSKISTISFPGLGISELEINSTAISSEYLGFLKKVFGENWDGIAWYGIIIMAGILLSAAYGLWRSKQEGISNDDMLDIILVAVIVSVLGARIYYVVFNGGYDSFYELIAVWNGGLAIYGAVIGGILSLILMAKIKKVSAFKLLDIGASSIILGQSIGRWGNFMNAEAYGSATTLPWRMCAPSIASEMYAKGLVDTDGYNAILAGTLGVHPTFFYESLWNLIGFFLIWSLYKKKKYDGQIFLIYLAWYGFGRMFIEGLRTDSLWLIPNVIRISQLVAAVCFAVCTALLVFFAVKRKNKEA